ncbi:NETI motif-containing protein [Niallia circulans]|uniref:NETI motif-containing protein n=1 Tax=Niallia circulans TaxID=1397 RepID=A0A553SGP6_NIACI|nr:NETI motif-containing protein [Niallia circulans]TRZ36158.1 NETI motif-containing protein [Niallia circulans]
MGKKMKFEVLENETISECLDRIQKEGYTPVKRIEKPIFKETIVNGQKSYEPVASQVIFEAVQLEG